MSRRILVMPLLLASMLAATPAEAASTARVRDINPTSDSLPDELTPMKVGTKRYVFFRANDGTNGAELWRTNGTSSGTTMVRNIAGGSMGSEPGSLTVMKVGSKKILFFEACTAVLGCELHRSDGTYANTFQVRDINPSGGNAGLDDLTVMKVGTKRFLFFQACDGDGCELWKSDGTQTGTVQVRDIDPGSGSSYPTGLTVMKVGRKRLLFFKACDAASSCELWRSDGTHGGTKRVRDINPSGSSNPAYLTVLRTGDGPRLLFNAFHPSYGDELWRSDGTGAGTKLVKNIYPSSAYGSPEELKTMKVGRRHLLFFSACEPDIGCELWRSTGTTGGTERVRNINPGSSDSDPQHLTVMKVDGTPTLFFSGRDDEKGIELWRSNGRTNGTKRVKDIHPSSDSDPEHLTVAKFGRQRLLFFKACGVQQCEPWRSDGTKAGTKIVKDISDVPGGHSSPDNFTSFRSPSGRIMLFAAYDETFKRELWRHRP